MTLPATAPILSAQSLFTPAHQLVWGFGDPDDPELLMNGRDQYGVEWYVDVKGWKGSAEVDLPADEKPGDGVWLGPGKRRPRILEFRGMMRACSSSLLDDAEERLADAVEHLTEDTYVTVSEPVPKQMAVRQSSKLDIITYRGQRRAREFSFNMTAADPLKYAAGAAGLQRVEMTLRDPAAVGGARHPMRHPLNHGGARRPGGQRTVINEGRVAVPPVVEIRGPAPIPRLINASTGEFFGMPTILGVDDRAVIDMGAQTVHINGVSRFNIRLATSAFWTLRRGSNDLRFAATDFNPAARAFVSWRPAWK